MAEIIGLEDLQVNFDQTVEQALIENKFIMFRIHPSFRIENNFRSKFKGIEDAKAHFFNVPAGYEIKDLPQVMEERIMRGPKDIREVIAVGKTLSGERYEHYVFAPEITGAPHKLLKILRYVGWTGAGLLIESFDSTEKNLWDLDFIGFSNT